ncbi:MAG: hypothetical protein LBB87_01295 [Nitrososphaerota archaeon]|jgi:N-acetylneuraminic acid mutarotase|nr:hypothetical protein [Nitrososphaerota archaeon]
MHKVLVCVLFFFLISALFVTTFSSVSSSELLEDTWNTKTPMKYPRSGLGVVAVDGKIYAMGGIDGIVTNANDYFYSNIMDSVVAAVECYDPASDSWVTLEPMPTPRVGFAIAAYQGKIYCIGGQTSDYVLDLERTVSVTCNVVEVYDTVTNSWSVKAAMPFYGSGLVGHVLDGKIFVRDKHELYMYDPVADIWAAKTSMSTFTPLNCVSTVIDGKIMTCATFMDFPPNTELRVLIYDPKTDVWHDGTWPPFEAVGMDAAVATMGIFAPKNVYFLGIGGISTLESTLENTKVYDPLKNIWWSTDKTIPTGRTNFGVAVVDDILYVVGGTFVGPEGPYYTEDTWRASAVNEQYVPFGYSSILVPEQSNTTIEQSNLPVEPSGSFLTETVIAVIILTAGIVATGLFFYFKKVHKKDGKWVEKSV